jgi:hypothetical protein
MTSQRWRVNVDYQKTVLEVYFDTVMALYEELFDFLDPTCHYESWRLFFASDPQDTYLMTLMRLALEFGLVENYWYNLYLFLKRLQDVFLETTRTKIQYMYTGLIECTPLLARHHARLYE